MVGVTFFGNFDLASLAIWDRKARWIKDLGWTWGLILFAAITLPWAMMITVRPAISRSSARCISVMLGASRMSSVSGLKAKPQTAIFLP